MKQKLTMVNMGAGFKVKRALTQVCVRLTKPERDEVKALAESEQLSMSEIFKKALTFYSGYLEGRK